MYLNYKNGLSFSTMQNIIDYSNLLDDAMYVIVKKVLALVSKNGLPGNHHFFISFATDHPGVVLSKRLAAQYPKYMTIVLQYQFDNLKVLEEHFEVSLNFNETNEHIVVPFAAIEVYFSLQFKSNHLISDETNQVYFEDNNYTKDTEPVELTKVPFNPPRRNNVISLADYKRKKQLKL
ncbi:MAG: ClpXP protease specificity-enhancing factor SspB [Candidatus Midichloria sp.]|nr:ClpXP protease specificity-enhancing factor SspB [Candidatus Midichloria sp.]